MWKFGRHKSQPFGSILLFSRWDCWVIWAMDMLDTPTSRKYTACECWWAHMGWLGWLRKGEEIKKDLRKKLRFIQLYVNRSKFSTLPSTCSLSCIYSHPKCLPTSWGEFVLQFFRWFETGPPRWILHPAEVTSRHLQLFRNHQCHCWQPPDRWLAACSGYLRRDATKHLGATVTIAPQVFTPSASEIFVEVATTSTWKFSNPSNMTSPYKSHHGFFGTSKICLGFVNCHSFHRNNEVK